MRDPLRRLPTGLRLWAALALCVAPARILVSQSPIRVFLALAIAVFAVCALRPRTSATRTAARVACAGLVAAVAIAAANGASAAVLCLIGALLLVGPLVGSRTPSAGVLA